MLHVELPVRFQRRPLVLSAELWVVTVSGPNLTSDELLHTQDGPCAILSKHSDSCQMDT